MNLRKMLLLILASVLIFSTGCSDNAAVIDKETGASVETVANSNGLPPATLTFLLTGEEKDRSGEVLDKVAEECGLNIKLDFKYFSDMYLQQVETYIASGQKFDAMYVGMPEPYEVNDYSANYIEMARRGKLKDITDLLPEYAPNILSQFDPKDLEAAKIDGKLYAVPSLYPQIKSISIRFDPELVTKYGIKPVNTFEDYGVFLETVKENEKDVIPGEVDVYDPELFTLPYGYTLVDNSSFLLYKSDDPEMKIIPWEQTGEFKNITRMLCDWQKKGYIARIEDGIDKVRASFLFIGQTLKDGPSDMTFGNGQNSHVYKYYGYIMYKNVKLPRLGPIGNVYRKGAIALNAESGNVERTLMFLDWVQSGQENYDLLMYGIKDKDYTLDENKLVFYEEDKESYSAYLYWFNNPFRNIKYARVNQEDADGLDDYQNEYRDYVMNRTFSAPNAGFYPDYRSVKAALATRVELFQSLIISSFHKGTFDPAQIDAVIRQLKDAGTDSIVGEVQRQLDEWRSK